MRRLTTLITTGLVTALAIGALAAPTAAADKGRMTVVNGIPGTKIDICVGSTNEIRSGLKYGGVFKKQLIGTKKLRFREAAPGTCKGQLLAGRTVGFPSGSDKTVVPTKKLPSRVLVFDNKDLGTKPAVPAPPVSALAMRHAADLSYNTIHFHLKYWSEVGGGPVRPRLASEDVNAFGKGDEFTSGLASTSLWLQAVVTRQNDTTVLRRSPIFGMVDLRRYEFYFVGTSAANAKLVRVTSVLASAPGSTP